MFSITEAILKAHQADSLEKETPDASMTRNEDGCCSPVPSDLQFVEIALTESLGHYSSLSEIDLTCETELYKQCQSMTDVNELRNAAATFYGRLLEFVNRLAETEENFLEIQTKFERHVRNLKVKLLQAHDAHRLAHLDIDHLQAKLDMAEMRLSQKEADLEAVRETASTLTEWNSRLEEQVESLTDTLASQRDQLRSQMDQLDLQIIEATEKRIGLRCEYNQLEEENLRLRQLLHEQQDIQMRLTQENAILKSKLFNNHNKQSNMEVPRHSSIENSNASNDAMAIELQQETRTSLRTILSATSIKSHQQMSVPVDETLHEVDILKDDPYTQQDYSMKGMAEKAVYFENVNLGNRNVVVEMLLAKVSPSNPANVGLEGGDAGKFAISNRN